MKYALLVLATMTWSSPLAAEYVETMDPHGPRMNLQQDFGLIDDNAQSNQSAKLQRAIDTLAARGGGQLFLPKGAYRFSKVYLKSNVHLLIERDTVITPYWPKGEKTVVFLLDVQAPLDKKEARKRERDYIENVSIRGLGGRFVVDYSDRERRSRTLRAKPNSTSAKRGRFIVAARSRSCSA